MSPSTGTLELVRVIGVHWKNTVLLSSRPYGAHFAKVLALSLMRALLLSLLLLTSLPIREALGSSVLACRRNTDLPLSVQSQCCARVGDAGFFCF